MKQLAAWHPLVDAPFFRQAVAHAKNGGEGCAVQGLIDGARALTVDLLARQSGKKILLIVPDDAAMDRWRRELATFAKMNGGDVDRVVLLPALDADPYGGLAPHPEVVRERVVVLEALARQAIDLLIVPARGLLHPLPSPTEWNERLKTIRLNDTLPPDRFVLEAIQLGYRRVDIVSAPGEVSRRGGIIDIFSPTASEPVRIELFGDTVDSLRSFDTDNQRSTGSLDEVIVAPASESPPTDDAVGRVQTFLEGGAQRAQDDGESIRPFRARLEQLQEQGAWPGFEALTRLTYNEAHTLFSYTQDFLTIVDEPEATEEALITADHDLRMIYEQSEDRVLPPPHELFCDVLPLRERLHAAGMFLQELAGDPPASAENTLEVGCARARTYSGRIAELAQDLEQDRKSGRRVVCLMRTEGSVARLKEILEEYRLVASPIEQATVGDGGLFVDIQPLPQGFEFRDAALTVLTERDLFGTPKRREEK